MKVILNQTVPKLGKEGTVVKVADGYARNYLFPRGLAILADKKQVEVLERRRAKTVEAEAKTQSSAEELRDQVDGKTVRIEGKVGKDTGRLFGAITSQDVAEAIKSQLGFDIERRKIALIEPIKRLGQHPVHLDLHRQVDATITVHVYDPAAPSGEEAQEVEGEQSTTLEE